jgi:hypothetical protein
MLPVSKKEADRRTAKPRDHGGATVKDGASRWFQGNPGTRATVFSGIDAATPATLVACGHRWCAVGEAEAADMSRAWAVLACLLAGAVISPAAAAPLACPCKDCALARGVTRESYPGTGEPQVVSERAGKAMANATRQARQVAAGVRDSVGRYCMSPCSQSGEPKVAVQPQGSEMARGPWAEARVQWTIIGTCVLPGLD